MVFFLRDRLFPAIHEFFYDLFQTNRSENQRNKTATSIIIIINKCFDLIADNGKFTEYNVGKQNGIYCEWLIRFCRICKNCASSAKRATFVPERKNKVGRFWLTVDKLSSQ